MDTGSLIVISALIIFLFSGTLAYQKHFVSVQYMREDCLNGVNSNLGRRQLSKHCRKKDVYFLWGKRAYSRQYEYTPLEDRC